jgi:alpha-D-ribose 1-methylphosphonate 5-triphosphate diphosphatase PhnM
MKFERGKDPKKALGVGIFTWRHFDTIEEAKKWFIQNHISILGLKRLCDPWPTPEQFAELRSYANKYIHYSAIETWPIEYFVDSVAQFYRESHEVRNAIIKGVR